MKHDWVALETEYIQTKISYRQMAEKYNISLGNIFNYGKKNKWVEKRKQYHDKVIAKTVNKTANFQSNKLAKLIKSADKMAGVIDGIFDDTKQFNRHIVDKGERVFKKIDTKSIRDLTAAMKDLTAVIRDLNNLPMQTDKQEAIEVILKNGMDDKWSE